MKLIDEAMDTWGTAESRHVHSQHRAEHPKSSTGGQGSASKGLIWEGKPSRTSRVGCHDTHIHSYATVN